MANGILTETGGGGEIGPLGYWPLLPADGLVFGCLEHMSWLLRDIGISCRYICNGDLVIGYIRYGLFDP